MQHLFDNPGAASRSILEFLGFKKYVVEYNYDNMGRLVNKTIRDTPLVFTDTALQDSGERFGADYQYDGRGRLVRERIMRYDPSTGRMAVT